MNTRQCVSAAVVFGCLSIAPAAAVFAASTTATTPSTTTPTKTTTTKTTTKTTTPTTTTPTKTTTTKTTTTTKGTTTTSSTNVRYLLRAGSFKTKAAADAQLAKVTAAGIKGFSVVQHKNGRYWVQETGLSKHNGLQTFKKLNKAHIKSVLLAR
jgi:cell division protein FtsN